MSAIRAVRLVSAVFLVLLLAACGSQLDPGTVADVNGSGPGAEAGAPGADAGAVGPGDVAGTDAAAVDPGAAAPGAAAPGDAASGPASGGPAASGGGGTKGSATGGTKAASCAGFQNQKGITDKTIKIANVADISGPVPGIFESTQQATRAYVDYFNSQSTICGRKLELVNLDSRADAGADQQAYVKACDQAFAAVGSMSAFDSGGAATAAGCGLPDIRAVSVNPERAACKTCFATYAIKTNLIPEAGAKFLAQKFPEAVKKAAFLYVNAGAAPINVKSEAAGYEKAGWNAVYVQGIDVSEFNFTPYVQAMKDKGVRIVTYVGPYQNSVKLQQAMQQQGFKPDAYFQDPTVYDKRYLEQAGSLAEGTYIYSANGLFEDKNNKEIQLYLSYLQQVKPGAIPNYYGLYAWSAARLFVEKSLAIGGGLTRASLVQSLKSTKGWTGNGAHTAMDIGTSRTPPCLKMAQYKGGRWQQVSSGDYICGRVFDTGIGG